jgi:hypothetical protein
MSVNLLELHAREKLGMPEDWRAYRYECFPKINGGPTLYIEVTGIVAPLMEKGRRKGLPDWRHEDKASRRKAILPVAEHDQWVLAWSRREQPIVMPKGNR